MTTNTATRLQAVRRDTIEDVRTQGFWTFATPYATGERNFLEDCKADGLLTEDEAELVTLYSDGLVTESELDQIDQSRQVWQPFTVRREVTA